MFSSIAQRLLEIIHFCAEKGTVHCLPVVIVHTSIKGNPELEADVVQYIEKRNTNYFLHTFICKINEKITCIESVQEVQNFYAFFS